MKSLIVATLIALTSVSAKADGFVCETLDSVLRIKIYNHVTPENGTRNPAVMILSDTTVGVGNKTIAKFEAGETLENSRTIYKATVDHRYNDSGRKGELLLGTKIGYLKKLHLLIGFSYANPMEDGELTTGLLAAIKRDGSVIHRDVVCSRYLKN